MVDNATPSWRCQYEVRYGEANRHGLLKLRALADYFQEAAADHAENLGVGYSTLSEAKMLWVLSRMGIEILRLPEVNETVTLETWPRRGTSPLFAMREFTLCGAGGELLVRATSAWLLLDAESFRPRRISTLPGDLPQNTDRPYLYQMLDEVRDFEAAPAFSERIRESKIDVNQHLNNAEYFTWLEDCAAEAGYRAGDLRRIFINFVGEVKCYDTVEICVDGAPGGAEFSVAGVKRSDGKKAFRAVMEFGQPS